MKYIIPLIFLLSTSIHAAEFIPKKLSQMTDDLGVGTHTADTSDPHGTTTTQTNLTVGSLTVTNSISLGTITLSGYIKDNAGSATATQLTSVQINSGTATLSAATVAGIAAPYVAQTNGTGIGNTLTSLKVVTALMVGTTTQDALCEIYGGNVDFERTDSAPLFSFYRNSATPAAEDSLGVLYFFGNNATPTIKEYAKINGVITDKTAGSEDGRIGFWAMVAGVTAERMRLEGDSLGIGTTTPQTKLAVAGDISIQSSGYLNFNPGVGTASTGYGIRDNSGTTQFKNNAGTWTDIPTGASGGGFIDNGTTITEITVTDQVVFGSTTPSSRIVTCVGSSTFLGQLAIGSNSVVFGGLTPFLDLIIGDYDTGLKWDGDGILSIYGNNNKEITIDGNTSKIRIGTTTAGSRLNVGGTVTAEGFSGIAFPGVTGSTTSAQMPSNPTFTGTLTATNFSGSGAGITDIVVPGTLTVSAIQATSTASTFGTTTQHNSSNVTLFGSGTSPVSVVVNRLTSDSGTNTTAIMTGTSTPAPNEVTASQQSDSFPPWEAFDRVMDAGATNRWVTATGGASWLRYDFGTGTTKTVTQYNIAIRESTYAPSAWTFEGNQTPQDGGTWVVLNTQSGIGSWVGETYKTFAIASGSISAYRSYRLNITTGGASNTEVTEMQFIGAAGQRENYTSLFVTSATGTVLVGTTTVNGGTTTPYIFQIGGSGLATSWGVTCYEAIKSIVSSGSETIKQGYDAVIGTKLFTHHPKIRNDITLAQAEDIVRNEYVNSFTKVDFETFKTNSLGNYTTVVAGSSSVNWKKFKEDFEVLYVNPRKDEFYALPDKNKRVKDKKIALESDTSITNISPVSDDPSTPAIFKRGDPKILDLENQIGALIGAAQKLDEMVKTQDAEIKDLKKKMGIP